MLVIGVYSVQNNTSLLVGIKPDAANTVITAFTSPISSMTTLKATLDSKS